MIVRVEEVIEQDEFQTQHGSLLGWKFRATDLGTNESVMLGINTKPNNAVKVGDTFDFEPSGKFAGVYTLGKRAQNQGAGRNAPANGHRPAQSHGAGGAATHAAPARKDAPTVTERGREIIALGERALKLAGLIAPEDATGDGLCHLQASILMHWLIGRDRGDIRDDPTAAEIEAAEAAEAERLAEAQRILDAAAEKAKQAAMARLPKPTQGYSPAAHDDGGDIPF